MCVLQSTPPVLLKKNHNRGSERTKWEIPYGQTLRDVLDLLYSLHVHKKSKFLFNNN